MLSWETADEEGRRKGKGGQRQREARAGARWDEYKSDNVTVTTAIGG